MELREGVGLELVGRQLLGRGELVVGGRLVLLLVFGLGLVLLLVLLVAVILRVVVLLIRSVLLVRVLLIVLDAILQLCR